ncbi:MAG: spore coat protein CotJB [Lawsonibacter sp.]
MLELGIYLDTHPDDMEAFQLFQQYAAMEKSAKAAYESGFGPLMKSTAATGGHPTVGSRTRGPGTTSRMR